jgi:hypothetical protein
MHPVMSDSTLFILETEARQAREAARRAAMTSAPSVASRIGSLLTRLAHAVWQAAHPRGYALNRARSRTGKDVSFETALPVPPSGWTPGSGEWPDTFAYSPAGMVAGQPTMGNDPETATIAALIDSAQVGAAAVTVEKPWRELASGGDVPIEILDSGKPEKIPA